MALVLTDLVCIGLEKSVRLALALALLFMVLAVSSFDVFHLDCTKGPHVPASMWSLARSGEVISEVRRWPM